VPGVARWWSLLLVVGLVVGVGVWMISPRFVLDTPSLVDDWAAIERSGEQLEDVVRLLNPEPQRFRPGWIAWNYVQWNTFDAPQGLVGPNVWNVVRLLILVAGPTLLTALALPPPRTPQQSLLLAALAGLPALLLVTAPLLAIDLARFGPQEPMLFGAMALGGSLLLLAARSVLDRTRPVARSTIVLGVAGGALWALGAYHKETSLAVLPLLAAVAFAGRERLADWRTLSRGRRAAVAALVVVVVAPLVHVVVESARITLRGDLVYDAEVDAGRGLVEGTWRLLELLDDALPFTALLVLLAAPLLTALVAVRDRRLDPIAVGALASGALALVLAGQSGAAASRYYLPSYALFAVAFALSLTRFRQRVQVACLAAIVTATLLLPNTREFVGNWSEEEERQGALVQSVADLERAGCPLEVAGLEIEAKEALPALVALVDASAEPACDRGDSYLVVGPLPEGAALLETCSANRRQRMVEGGTVGDVYRCRR
jgi:hypothetical protein